MAPFVVKKPTTATTSVETYPEREALRAELLGLQDEKLYLWMCSNVSVPAVCDTLDDLGFRLQAMHQRLRPLDRRCCSFAGRARTMLWTNSQPLNDDPYGLEIAAMDSLGPWDVVIHSTDEDLTNAPWGELMSTVAKRNGAVGCVCDSNIRDTDKIIDLGFPVFHVGIRPVDSKGRARVIAYDVPIRCGEVAVGPGDLVFADCDGVVVIPKQIERKVVLLSFEKITKERASLRELAKGKSLREVFGQFGVL